MAFDAGAIESTMTVDRSPFRRGLRASRREAEDFARQRYSATLDLDTQEAQQSLRKLRSNMARADSLARHMQVTADTSGATSAMKAVEAQQRRLQSSTGSASVGVDTTAATARIAALEGQLARLHQTQAEPSVRLKGFKRTHGQAKLLQSVLIGLGPAVVPVVATATGGIMALAGALGAAAAAGGVFGVAAAGQAMELAKVREQVAQLDEQIKQATPGSEEYNELIQQRTELMDQLNPRQEAVLSSLDALTKEFKEFGSAAQPEILGVFKNGLDGVRQALVVLKPAVEPVALTMLRLSERFKDAMNGPGMKTFRDWIMTNGPPAILYFANTLVNLGATVGNLVVAFQPLQDRLVATEGAFAGLREATAGLSESPQFREFLDYIVENGPLVSSTLLAIIDAIAQIGWALAPVAPYILQFVRAVAETTASVAEAHPWVVQLAWAGLLVSRLWGPMVSIMGAVNGLLRSQAALWLLTKTRMIAYRVAMTAVRVATMAWAAAQWLLNAALLANPIVLLVVAIVAAVALIVGAVIYAWNNFEWFRNGVMAVWEAIKTGAMWLYTNGIKPAFDFVVAALVWVRDAALGFYTHGIKPMVDLIVSRFQLLWQFIGPIIGFIVKVGFALLLTAIGLMLGAWKSAFSAMQAAVLWLWNNAVKPAVDGIVWLWVNFLMPQIRKAKAAWDVIMRALGAVAQWLWDKVISPVVGWIVGRWVWLVRQFKLHKAAISLIFRAIGDFVDGLRDRFKAGFDRIKDFASDVLDTLRGMRDSAKNIFRALANHARKPINWVINTVYNDGIRQVARRVLNSVGMSKMADKLPVADTIPRFAGGGSPMDPSGFVRGAGGPTSDEITARIANREFVVNARATRLYRPVLEWINNQGRRGGGAPAMAEGGVPAMAGGGLLDSALGFAKDAVLGASTTALSKAFDALGLSRWVSQLKSGPPVWEGGAGGALSMATDGLLSFLDKKDKEGGNAMAVVKAARRSKMEGSDYDNRYTRAFGMPGAPWCAMYASEMIADANAQKQYNNVRSAAVASFANSSLASVGPGAARPGDLAVYRGQGPSGWGHINIVTDPERHQSIGGNESNRIRTQHGYYLSAAKLMRPVPGAAEGGFFDDALMRTVLGQDYEQTSKAGTSDRTAFLRTLAGLPAYQEGGEVQHRASGGRLSAGQVAWVGEDGPELVRMGSSGGVSRSDRSIDQMAEAFIKALEKWRGAGGGRGGGSSRGGGVTINGIATTEAVRVLAHREAVAAAADLGSPGRDGAPSPSDVLEL